MAFLAQGSLFFQVMAGLVLPGLRDAIPSEGPLPEVNSRRARGWVS